jgi:hypothetical protein
MCRDRSLSKSLRDATGAQDRPRLKNLGKKTEKLGPASAVPEFALGGDYSYRHR